MAFPHTALDQSHTQPLVTCVGCGFAWYGRTAAHGLSVIGHCSRCGGDLQFHDAADASPPPADESPVADERGEDLQPWQVLGTPTSWAG